MSGHIICRSGRFSWRRSIQGTTIQIPLRTTDRRTAKEVAAAATAASYAVFYDIRHCGLDRATGRGIIERATAMAAARLTLCEDLPQMFFFPFPFETVRTMRERGWPESQIRTWIRGRLHQPTDEDLRGWDPKDVAEYRAILNDVHHAEPENAAAAPGQVVIHNHYHAPASHTPALHASSPLRHSGVPEHAEAAKMGGRGGVSGASAPSPVPDHPEETVEAPSGRTPIPDLVETIIASDRRRNRVNEATAKGFRTSIALFCEICRINDAEEITQDKLMEFCEMLERIPPNYRRGSTGRATPILAIIEKAESEGVQTGLSAKTVNKQLEALKKLIRHASTKINLPALEVSILRVRDDESVKEKRFPFTLDEVRRLFSQPGLNLESERTPLFWNAHLAAYTGARREELAGLATEDVTELKGIPVILIRSNAHRKLKNGQSERFVPVHPDLIDLGFLDYAAGRGPGLLFDVKKKGKTFGNHFEYGWQKVKNAVIADDDRKTFHSFRHSAVQTLIDANVPLHVRADLFGHDHEHIQGNLYGGLGKEEALLYAVKLLPSVR